MMIAHQHEEMIAKMKTGERLVSPFEKSDAIRVARHGSIGR